MTDSTFLERLKSVHDFPGPYVLKVIGENSVEFVTGVAQAVVNVVGKSADVEVSTRESSKGNHASVTIEFQAESADAVVKVYEVIQGMDGVRVLL